MIYKHVFQSFILKKNIFQKHVNTFVAYCIYCLKMFGFHHQLNITEKAIGILRRICLFITTVYACFWFSAPLTTEAPINDLLLLKVIENYLSS